MAAVVFVLAGLSSKADLLQADSPRFGPGSLTVDTRTGLSWLDLPLTQGLSFDQAEAETGPGGLLQGFRHATVNEVGSLYASAGFAAGFIAQSSPGFQNVTMLISLIGATEPTRASTTGITGTFDGYGLADYAYLSFGYQEFVPGYFVTSYGGSISPSLSTPGVANWMVMVPEPSGCALLFTGAASMLLLPRRKL